MLADKIGSTTLQTNNTCVLKILVSSQGFILDSFVLKQNYGLDQGETSNDSKNVKNGVESHSDPKV